MFLNVKQAEFVTYTLPLLVIVCSILLALSPVLLQYPEMSIAITYDLCLLAPLLFLLLSRKSKVSKLRAVPYFICGIAIATFLLPEHGQNHLDYIKTYLLPAVEVVVFSILIRKIYLGIKAIKSNAVAATDFYALCKKSTHEIFGKSKLASFLASEIAMMYYAFFAWKRKQPQEIEFTNHKENGSMALLGAILMIVFIETFALHLLLVNWNSWVAWILTITSVYTAIMILGHMKALLHRPSILTKTKLTLKNGLIADVTINLKAIDKIEFCNAKIDSEVLKIGNLGLSKEPETPAVAIYFKTPQTIEKIYGFTEECDILLVQIDSKNDFIKKVQLHLSELKN